MQLDLRPLKEILEWYCKRGYYLFPCKPGTKRPAIYDNLEKASNDITQLMRWAARFPGCNWGLSLAKSGLVAIDIDDDAKKQGLDKWNAYLMHHKEPDTWKAQSGSGSGLHYIFKAKPGVRYRGKISDGLDVKHNGFILVYPSIHPRTGRQYQFLNEVDPVNMAEWLCALTEKPKLAPKKKSREFEHDTDFYKKIILQLKEKSFGYDEWLRIGMALHAAFDGAEEGLELYLELTEGSNFKDGDLEQARYKWEGFKADQGGVSAGTFVFLARDLGCEIPSPTLADDKKLFADNPLELGDADSEPEWTMDYSGHESSNNASFIVDEINKLGYAMLNSFQDGKIIKHWTDEKGVRQFKMVQGEDFRNSLKHWTLRTVTSTGRPRSIPASEIWLKSTRKTRFRNVVFEPESPDNEADLNLWSDIPCAVREGDPSLALELVDVLCGHDKLKTEYLLDWCAHLVQRPWEKCITVPVLIGQQGTGKGLFTDSLLGGILSPFYIRFDKPGIIKERFNVEQSRKLLTVVDEASWRGDHELVGIMKSLTGSLTMTVEEKFGGRYTIRNYSRYLITSNDIESVRIETANRRYFICETATSWKGTGKFKELARLIREEGMSEIFYGWLLKRDISGFDPFAFPEKLDTGGEQTKVKSMGAIGQFWADIFFEDPSALFQKSARGICLSKTDAYQEFLHFHSNSKRMERNFSRKTFVAETEALVPVLEKTSCRTLIDGTQKRAWAITPFEFVKSFCERARIAVPKDFDDLEFIRDDDAPSKAQRDFDLKPRDQI